MFSPRVLAVGHPPSCAMTAPAPWPHDRFAFVLRNYWPGRRMPEQYRGRYAFLPLGYGQGWGAFEGQPGGGRLG